MEIHKGHKYRITTDGIAAKKTDGNSIRTMKYYPERDLSAIAGEIDELTAWQILKDVASQATVSKTPLSPEHIFIDGGHFVRSEWSESKDGRFVAPEGYSDVWALGATVFNVFLGCHVFQGLGGKGQTATTPVPTLRKELPELSGIIIQCLDFDPEKRPSMTEIEKSAEENIARCLSIRQEFPPLKKTATDTITADETDTYWPEEMC